MIRRFFVPALVAGLALAAPATGQTTTTSAVPVDSVLKGFHQIGDFELVVDGAVVAAEIYQLDSAASYLLVTDKLVAPVLVSTRTKTVETVPLAKVQRNADHTADLLADAILEPSGSYQIPGGKELSFKVGGKTVVLRDRPPLLGTKVAGDLMAYSPEYGRLAKAYNPSEPVLKRLREQGTAAEVTVYFGSWCPHCKQMVPRLMRVAEGLAGSKIKISYYGLPREFNTDMKAKDLKIEGVPTAVITVGGKEIGRINGNGFKIPELAISNALQATTAGKSAAR